MATNPQPPSAQLPPLKSSAPAPQPPTSPPKQSAEPPLNPSTPPLPPKKRARKPNLTESQEARAVSNTCLYLATLCDPANRGEQILGSFAADAFEYLGYPNPVESLGSFHDIGTDIIDYILPSPSPSSQFKGRGLGGVSRETEHLIRQLVQLNGEQEPRVLAQFLVRTYAALHLIRLSHSGIDQ